LRRRGLVEPVTGGEIDGLQDRVHGAAERGAVPALVPGRQLEITRALVQPGVERRLLRDLARDRGRGADAAAGPAGQRVVAFAPPLSPRRGGAAYAVDRRGHRERYRGRIGGERAPLRRVDRGVPQQLRVRPGGPVVARLLR